MSDIEDQFQPIAHEYGAIEADTEKSRYELEVNWPSIKTLLPAPPVKVLDYGCGSGVYSYILAKAGYQVTATDNAPDMIAQLKDSGIDAQVWSYRDDALPGVFDVIIAKLVVQFVDDLELFAKAMRRQLAPNGWLIISVPNPDKSRSLIEDGDVSYVTKIGTSDLTVTMIHRELPEYEDVFGRVGLHLARKLEPIDADNLEAASKRLNMLFQVS